MRKFYALYDTQTGNYMETGKNSFSKEQIKDSLIEYLSIDHTPKEINALQTMSPDVLADLYYFKIEENTAGFEDTLND